MARPELIVSPDTPLPKGYGFLRKGYPFKTALCRRETHAANKTLYVVKEKSQVLGLRAPIWILAEVGKKERATRGDRRETVAKRDGQAQGQFQQTVKELYPRMPEQDAAQIANWALRKRSGRVGRTSTLPLETKVHLAVAAHARHRHTDYEKQVRQTTRDAARKAVLANVQKLLARWKGEAGSEQDPIVLDQASSEPESEEHSTDNLRANSPRKATSRTRRGTTTRPRQTAQRNIPVRKRGQGG